MGLLAFRAIRKCESGAILAVAGLAMRYAELLRLLRALPAAEKEEALDELLQVMALLLEERAKRLLPSRDPSLLHPEFCAQCPLLRRN